LGIPVLLQALCAHMMINTTTGSGYRTLDHYSGLTPLAIFRLLTATEFDDEPAMKTPRQDGLGEAAS